MKRLTALLLAVLPACGPPRSEVRTTPPRQAAAGPVRPGIEVFVERPPALVRGKRVGLITNQTGIDRQRRSTIDLVRAMPELRLVALFSPEHGIRGVADARVDSSIDEKSGLPIHSLYGSTYRPTPQMLEGIDVLLYDIQDLGVRQYTYESTLALALQAAAEQRIPVVVLDRPNPVTGTVLEGNILEPAYQTFVGIYPVLSRHGLTLGELARLYNTEQRIGAELTVVPVEGWRRTLWWDQLGLPWVNPSPNIRRFEATLHYPGTVFFEAVNLSEGRGTNLPFEQIGAPWLKNREVAAAMNALRLPGIRFEPADIPSQQNARRYPGEMLKGIKFIVTDRETYRPIAAALRMIELIRRLHPNEFEWTGRNPRDPNLLTIERHGGTARLRQAIEAGTVADLLREWERDQAAFARQRAPYLLYP
jgi:uncharacterized protein YbbC (DUF1343 family)